MKNILFAIAIFAISLSSCGNKSTKETGTHTHDDGTVHENHNHGSEEMPEQELFEVQIDSLSNEKDSLKSEDKTEHSHDGGHKHTH